MKKTLSATVVAVLVSGGIAACSGESNETASTPAVEPAAPAAAAPVVEAPPAAQAIDFTMPDIDGVDRALSEWNGQGRLINFWATWCAPCRREIPLLKATQEAHGDANVQIIGVAVDDAEPVRAYAEEAQFNYPILVGQDEAMEAAETSGVDFIALPFTMIVAPGGELLKTHTGEIHQPQIDQIVAVFADLESGALDIAGAQAALDGL